MVFRLGLPTHDATSSPSLKGLPTHDHMRATIIPILNQLVKSGADESISCTAWQLVLLQVWSSLAPYKMGRKTRRPMSYHTITINHYYIFTAQHLRYQTQLKFGKRRHCTSLLRLGLVDGTEFRRFEALSPSLRHPLPTCGRAGAACTVVQHMVPIPVHVLPMGGECLGTGSWGIAASPSPGDGSGHTSSSARPTSLKGCDRSSRP